MSLLLLALGAALAGQGLQVDHVRAQSDKIALRVELTDPRVRMAATGSDQPFQLTLDHGQVQSTTAHRMAGSEVLTLVALDQSGSFYPYRESALGLARLYVRNKREGERVGLVLFGLTAEAFPTTADQEQALGHVSAATMRPIQRETRLNEFVRQAAARAHAELPPSEGGLRQIVLFTDGGEESRTWSVDEVAEELEALDVRVHVVVFYKSSKGNLAQRLDQMSRLASLTGGTYQQVESVQQSEAAMVDLAANSGASWQVEAQVCGQAPQGAPRFTNHVVASLAPKGERLAWSDAIPFEQVALLPCAALAPSQAQQDAIDEAAAPEEPRSLSTWACLCPTAALLLAIIAVAALAFSTGLSRRDEEEEDEEDDELTPTPPPPRARAAKPEQAPPEPSRPEPSEPFMGMGPPPPQLAEDLPETHLVAVQGSLTGQRWRFRGRGFTAGAGPDNDLVADLDQVSTEHARLELYPSGDVYITDLGSTNGTWVEGRRLVAGERCQVRPGERIALSSQLLLELQQPGRQP